MDVGIAVAKNRLTHLVRAVEEGEPVVITRKRQARRATCSTASLKATSERLHTGYEHRSAGEVAPARLSL